MKRVSYSQDLTGSWHARPWQKVPGRDKWQAGNMSGQEVRNNCVLNAKNVKVTQKNGAAGQ